MSQSTHHHGDGTYFNQIGNPRVGNTFEAYEGPHGRVAKNDIVVFDDPDAGHHTRQCELVGSWESVGYVDKVYAFDPSFRDEITPQIGIDCGEVGRLSIEDNYTYVIPTDGNVEVKGHPLREEATVPKWVFDMAMTLHNSNEWDRWWSRKHHYGWSAIGKDEVQNLYTCDKCANNEYGPTYTNGE